jgi:hypothetical protein
MLLLQYLSTKFYNAYNDHLGCVVAQWGVWWLSGVCGGSVGCVVAQRGVWWLSWLKQLGGTRQRTQLSRVRIRLPPQSPERGQEL